MANSLDAPLAGRARPMYRSRPPRKWGDILVLSSPGGGGRVVTFAGDRINRTLAKLLGIRLGTKVTAAYDEIRVHRSKISGQAMGIAITLKRLSENLPQVRDHLEEELAPLFRPFPFSPFAECLPHDLWTAVFIEQRLDGSGLPGCFRIRPGFARSTKMRCRDRDRGPFCDGTPPTPPCLRVRKRRFGLGKRSSGPALSVQPAWGP